MVGASLIKSLKSAIRKEVAKQVANMTGKPGTNGTNGLDGTALAYAYMNRLNCAAGAPPRGLHADACEGRHEHHPNRHRDLLRPPGISSSSVAPAVTVDWDGTTGPEGNASAITGTSFWAASRDEEALRFRLGCEI